MPPPRNRLAHNSARFFFVVMLRNTHFKCIPMAQTACNVAHNYELSYISGLLLMQQWQVVITKAAHNDTAKGHSLILV